MNTQRVDRLSAVGMMTEAGLAVVRAAQHDGSWTALDAVEELSEPDDLRSALDADPQARAHWNAFPRSTRRAILEWIGTARTGTTRSGRVEQTAVEAAAGRRAHQWRRPEG